MAPTLQELGLDQLSAEDRIALAHTLWDSAVEEIAHMPLTDPQRKELEDV